MLRHASRALRAALLSLALALTAAAETPPVLDWAQLWNGPDNHDDEAMAVAVDPGGDVLVAGTTYQLGVGANREDIALLRYAPDGTLLWFRRYGGDGFDAPSTVIIPEPGKTLVAGQTWDGTQDNATVLLYDVAGTLLWERQLPLGGILPLGFVPRLARAADGSLYLCASAGGDYLIAKLDADGNVLWTHSYDGPAGGVDLAVDLAVDANGAVVVTGVVDADAFPRSYGTVKVDADGVFQWEQFESGDFGSLTDFVRVAVAPGGDVLLAGGPESTCGVFEIRSWRLNGSTGAQQWLHGLGGEAAPRVRGARGYGLGQAIPRVLQHRRTDDGRPFQVLRRGIEVTSGGDDPRERQPVRVHAARAAGHCCRHHAMELSDDDGCAQDCACDRCGQCDHPEAGESDSAYGTAHG